MYQLTGLIIAGLMTGLAVGSGITARFLVSFSLKIRALFLLLFYTGFGLIYNYITDLKSSLFTVVIIVLSGFIPAFITGNIFRELTLKTDGITESPGIYGADLAGSAFGFIIISGFVIPSFGIKDSVFLLSVLIFSGILFGTIRNKM
jgi:hypothetical protein